MKNRNEILDLKVHELKFAIKKLEIHNKINQEAMGQFSDMFKDYIDSVEDSTTKHKLKKAAGLVGENEKRSLKTAKKVQQQKQYKKGKTKVKPEVEEEHIYQPPPETPKKELPKQYKSLYRKIASKTHPDKIKNDEKKKKILQEVNKAITEENYFKLIESALKLDIEIPDEVPINFDSIHQKISLIQNQIKQITKSVAWEWYHIEEEEKKKRLIEGYASYIIKNK
jgi:hypothetical protein